jgi:hypothetical protein
MHETLLNGRANDENMKGRKIQSRATVPFSDWDVLYTVHKKCTTLQSYTVYVNMYSVCCPHRVHRVMALSAF